MTRPLLLDLFCGAGGASMGYRWAGFDIIGVDSKSQPNYPFEFVQCDALDFLIALLDEKELNPNGCRVSAIHASPPCQWGTAYARRPNHVRPSQNMLYTVRGFMGKLGLPYVMEQPEHGRPHMYNPVRLCGSSFGLDVRRHRLFETNWSLPDVPCDHSWQTPRFAPATNRKNRRRTVEVGVWRIPLDVQQTAMGIDWMTREELSQAIPPAYTEHVGFHLHNALSMRDAA